MPPMPPERKEKEVLPWMERVNMLSINPEACRPQDAARMAANLSSLVTAGLKLVIEGRGKTPATFYPFIENSLFHMGVLPEQSQEGK